MTSTTRQQLLQQGMTMLLREGYEHLGIAALLDATKTPKGSFYHHFKSKEDFAMEVIDLYMVEVHGALDHCLGDESVPPVQRVRNFFEGVIQKYRGEGYLGCLLGGLGMELSGVSEAFRRKVEQCFNDIARRIGVCLREAARQGQLPKDTDPQKLAELIVNCWEGAALRSRMRRDPASLREMLDFCLGTAKLDRPV